MKKLERSFMNLLSTVTPGKNVQYFTGLLYFSKFDRCDVKSHLHKVTGRLPWPLTLIPVSPLRCEKDPTEVTLQEFECL